MDLSKNTHGMYVQWIIIRYMYVHVCLRAVFCLHNYYNIVIPLASCTCMISFLCTIIIKHN